MKIFLKVKVQPRARCQELERVGVGEYKLRVVSPPSKGEANREVIEVLASRFDLPQGWIRIIRGKNSRNKLMALEVDDNDALRLQKIKNLI